MKTALVFGATGQTGSLLTNILLAGDEYDKVKIFVRLPTGIEHAKLHEVVNPLTDPTIIKNEITNGDVFCCLGTTIKKAGSKENFRRIDYYLPVTFAKIAAQNGVKNIAVMSSIGADTHSNNFYLRTKGEMENAIAALGIENTVFVRPSLLLGSRQELRLGERIWKMLTPIINPLMIGGLKKYRGIHSATVAKAMVHLATDGHKGTRFIENNELFIIGK